ncbi:MAG TPA: MBL fold metallo-hydrolase [Syntrophales bacterium]|nr:MBL fold metallo-hydrolase [Syntrophales bacterium]HPI58068.1 MBL fold metallo-hydrolase [Syntrophales bacterium]HPN25284.1 MBL fold metallo-hydrolase [Syntrophales bacterium]HQM29297.1 MBL fold metallo-hydrolase [Syntrophales bacterium]
MYIKCWGSRGSIPVSGEEFNIYGGDTTCIEIRTKGDRVIIIDAGSGIRRLGNQLIKEGRYSYDILFTHAHWDHLLGFPFFRPLYVKKAELRIHSCFFAEQFVDSILGRVMSSPNFPVDFSDVQASIQYHAPCPEMFMVDSMRVEPIAISHPNQGNGYRFTEDGKRFVFITDNELGHIHGGGLPPEAYVEFSKGADLLMHDAEYTEEEYATYKGWGHSTWQSALELAVRAEVRKLGLFHHNQDRTDKEIDEIVDSCRKAASARGARMEIFAVRRDMTFNL